MVRKTTVKEGVVKRRPLLIGKTERVLVLIRRGPSAGIVGAAFPGLSKGWVWEVVEVEGVR